MGDREGRWSFALARGAAGAGRSGAEPGEGPFRPAIFLYERYPGGSGLAEGIHMRTSELLADALELVSSCPCASGCPSCVGPGGDAGEGAKATALRILSAAVRTS